MDDRLNGCHSRFELLRSALEQLSSKWLSYKPPAVPGSSPTRTSAAVRSLILMHWRDRPARTHSRLVAPATRLNAEKRELALPSSPLVPHRRAFLACTLVNFRPNRPAPRPRDFMPAPRLGLFPAQGAGRREGGPRPRARGGRKAAERIEGLRPPWGVAATLRRCDAGPLGPWGASASPGGPRPERRRGTSQGASCHAARVAPSRPALWIAWNAGTPARVVM